jgi:mannitol-specific phosphotransferase system IIBC component
MIDRFKIAKNDQFATIIDMTTTADVIYICKAAMGSSAANAVWQIKKINLAGGNAIVTWANGNSKYDNVANDRATTVTYS